MGKKKSKVQIAKAWAVSLSLHTKLAIGGVIIFLLFVCLLIAMVITTAPQQSDNDALYTDDQKARRDANVKRAQRDGAIRDNAEKAIELGDLEKAAEIYSSAIQSEQDTARKVQLYLDRSGLLYAANKHDEAIAVAREAESIGNDKFLVADWLSRIYEDRRQYKQAAQYYTLAGKWAKSPTNKTGFGKNHYDSEAARVLVLAGQK